MNIKKNIDNVLNTVGSKAIVVIAVKYANLEQIKTVLNAGATNLGFNTYQQMEEVKKIIDNHVKLHFIGTLQKNKAKKVMALNPALIQSIDSEELCQKINSAAKKSDKIQDILIQVKTDTNKTTGISPPNLEKLLKSADIMSHINILGLMTVHPYSDNPENSRQYFSKMNTYFKKSSKILRNKPKYLSMGMSNDYKIAIEEGANMVRIGSAIFR
ncbi:MAG: YggS family pyridoxal phosphate-dependent enzyme [Candidatus Nanohalarchaeota archaeon]|nr:MAG: YggS family pyridoxal phosphate-dependent enzyme [Candidatus Nanohaloarchaeota archaeon]